MNEFTTIPKTEIVWVQYLIDNSVRYCITSTKLRDIYYLYKSQKGKLVKTKYQNADPTKLERYMTDYYNQDYTKL